MRIANHIGKIPGGCQCGSPSSLHNLSEPGVIGDDGSAGDQTEIFKLFQVRSVREDDFEIHAADDHVFLRTTATIEFLPTGKSYTSRSRKGSRRKQKRFQEPKARISR